jgi:hypothetical protein
MILPQDQQEIVKKGEAYERLVTSPEWAVYASDIQSKRDMWLAFTASNADRAYLSAQAHTVNLLARYPFDVIDQKNAIIAEAERQIQAEKEYLESEANSEKLIESRPPPQAV